MRLALAVAVVLLAAPTNPAVAQRRNIDRQLRNPQSPPASLRPDLSVLEHQRRRPGGRPRAAAYVSGKPRPQRSAAAGA